MADFNVNHITGKQGQQGTVLAGVTTVSSTGSMRIPSGPTEQRGGRGRGILGGSYPAGTFLNKIEIATTGNATSFGTLTNHSWSYPSASSTRGVFAGGYIAPGPGIETGIDYVIFSSGGGGSNFGDLTTGLKMGAGFSDSTRGIFATDRKSVV